MRLTFLIACGLAAAAVAPVSAQPAATPAPAAPAIAFEGGRWFDGERFAPARWYSAGGRLTANRPARIDVTVNLDGRYVLPSLIEAHNHDAQSGRFGAISNAKNMAQGVFHSVQMCSKPEDRGQYGGFFGRPGTMEVLYADACISSSDGHPLGIAIAFIKVGMEVRWDTKMSLEQLVNEGVRLAYTDKDNPLRASMLFLSPTYLRITPGLLRLIQTIARAGCAWDGRAGKWRPG